MKTRLVHSNKNLNLVMYSVRAFMIWGHKGIKGNRQDSLNKNIVNLLKS